MSATVPPPGYEELPENPRAICRLVFRGRDTLVVWVQLLAHLCMSFGPLGALGNRELELAAAILRSVELSIAGLAEAPARGVEAILEFPKDQTSIGVVASRLEGAVTSDRSLDPATMRSAWSWLVSIRLAVLTAYTRLSDVAKKNAGGVGSTWSLKGFLVFLGFTTATAALPSDTGIQ